MFAVGCIQVVTGKDTAAFFRGKYADEQTAYSLIRQFAGGGLVEMVEKATAEFGFAEVGKNFAQRADLVLYNNDGHDTLGVMDFSGRFVMIAGKAGVIKLPPENIKRAWRIE